MSQRRSEDKMLFHMEERKQVSTSPPWFSPPSSRIPIKAIFKTFPVILGVLQAFSISRPAN